MISMYLVPGSAAVANSFGEGPSGGIWMKRIVRGRPHPSLSRAWQQPTCSAPFFRVRVMVAVRVRVRMRELGFG